MTIVQLTIPEPCPESWAAMTPTATGRHCAACAKTVVDFTQMSDAEILAHLARAMGETCGQLRLDQLGRPLVPAALAPVAPRWRVWLSAAAAVWGLREGASATATAQAPRQVQAAVPRQKPSPPLVAGLAVLHGIVRDSATQVPLVGVAVFLRGENVNTRTDSAGCFQLRLPARRPAGRALLLHFTGYHSRTVALPSLPAVAAPLALSLRPDPAAAEVVVSAYAPLIVRGGISGSVVSISAAPVRSAASRPVRPFLRWLAQPFKRRPTYQL